MALEHFMQEQLWLESGDFQKVWICGYEIFGEIIKRKWISTKPVGKMNLCAESWYLLNSDTKVKPNPHLKSKLNFINSVDTLKAGKIIHLKCRKKNMVYKKYTVNDIFGKK